MLKTTLHKDVIGIIEQSTQSVKACDIIRTLCEPKTKGAGANVANLVLVLHDLRNNGTLQSGELGWSKSPEIRRVLPIPRES